MRIGIFYNALLCALKNGEIESIAEGMSKLAEEGVCYYEVFADTVCSKEDEDILLSALEKTGCRVGNLYFKKELQSVDQKSMHDLLDFTKEKIEQCTRLKCKKLMPVITVHSDDECPSQMIHDYYKLTSEISDKYGILTVFENNTNSKTKCFTLNDVSRLMENSDKLSYLLDTGNYWFSKEDTLSAVQCYKGKIARVHLKDIMPEENSNPDDEHIKVRYATLGQGVSSVKDVIKNLKKSGYDKGFTIEIDDSNPILPRIHKSIDVIRQSESEIQLFMSAEEYYGIFFSYAKEYEEIGNEIELKTLHMLSVASLMNTLAIRLRVSNRMHRLAIITGLFHDIGRYEQFRQYNTFRDSISIDHADLSAEFLKSEDILCNLPEKDREMVITAVYNHNKYAIENGLDEETLLLCRMIRDADKIDCFRVVSSEPFESSYAVTERQLEESAVSTEIYESIMRHEMVVNTDRKYPLDFILSCCAFVFDINFPASREIIIEKNKYLCRLDALSYKNPDTERSLQRIFEEIDRYLST